MISIFCGCGCDAGFTSLVKPAKPIWTDSGIDLNAGDYVVITATGCWKYGPPQRPSGADGDPLDSPPASFDKFITSKKYAALLGYIDSTHDTNVCNIIYTANFGNIFFIGSNLVFNPATSGRLWLGINDDAVKFPYQGTCIPLGDGDNTGSLTVCIKALPPP